MRTYVVYDSQSGRIVHVHGVIDHTPPKPEDVLGLVNVSAKGLPLELLEIEPTQMHPGERYRIDPQTKRLTAAADGAHSAAAARQPKPR
jgi:hypothetical protein